MIKVKILGCGSSTGVPQIGCKCPVCISKNPKDNRLRPSILIQNTKNGQNILVDAGPDLRTQVLLHNIDRIDALFITHDHSDHITGLDDTKFFAFQQPEKRLPLYATGEVIASLKLRFPYLFEQIGSIYNPIFIPYIIDYFDEISVCGMDIKCFKQVHGEIDCLGLRVGDFAYSTDFKYLSDAAYKVLDGIKTWVIDCQKYHWSPSHLNYELTLQNVERVQPENAYLTHLAHDFSYDELCKILPKGIKPAHDGLELVVISA